MSKVKANLRKILATRQAKLQRQLTEAAYAGDKEAALKAFNALQEVIRIIQEMK